MIYRWLPKGLKAPYKKLFWRVFYNYIGTVGRLKPARFLNHGYAEEGVTIQDFTLMTLRKLHQDLYLHLFEQVAPDGKHVIEIGCGRGAGLALLNEQYKPAGSVGIDLSDSNIRRGKKLCKGLNVELKRGNAEKQMFPDKTFDIVFNLESSHCYVSKRKFYENVYAILKDDGCFVYADLFWLDSLIEEMEKEFEEVGFYIEKKENITDQTFRSIEIMSFARKYFVEGSHVPKKLLNNFVAAPGSELFESLKNGTVKYNLYVLRKK